MNKTQCTGCWVDCEGVTAGASSGAGGKRHCKRMLTGGVNKFECCETRAGGGWSDAPSSQLLALWTRNNFRITQLSFCAGAPPSVLFAYIILTHLSFPYCLYSRY